MRACSAALCRTLRSAVGLLCPTLSVLRCAGNEHQEALCLTLGGYSHKMKVLLERAVHRLTSFGDSLVQEKEEEEGQGDEVCKNARVRLRLTWVRYRQQGTRGPYA